MTKQIAIPCCLMRGGTSKGPFFLSTDLPRKTQERDAYLLAAMGSPDRRQIDGVGGAHSLTSKAGIVSVPDDKSIDLSFLFAQLQPESDLVDTAPNCGNMLAAVVPFAIEMGLIKAKEGQTTARVLTENTGMISEITVQTPNGSVTYDGDARIDGVPNSSSPVEIKFLDTAGSVCGSLFPTGNVRDQFEIDGIGLIDVTCIDNGMPMVLFHASEFGVTGYESAADYNENNELKEKVEALRLKASLKMGLGDVSSKNYPKMCLLAEPIDGGTIHTRCYIPHVCHDAIGVLAAVTVATACVYSESVAYPLSSVKIKNNNAVLSIEHPTGEFSVVLDLEEKNSSYRVVGAALLRTARLLMKGEVMLSPKKLEKLLN